MKIDLKILSIPPYISTSWDNIVSLHVENKKMQPFLIATLTNGSSIEIPNLPEDILKKIFMIHTQVLELGNNRPRQPNLFTGENEMGFPLKIGIEGVDGMGAALQHNSELADSPDLPPEVLQKIAAISKALGIDDPNMLPKPEPHCNCMHCQVAKAIHQGTDGEDIVTDEEVNDQELTFREWDIEQTGEKLYLVTNPLDTKEHYTVFLGEPVGCTCGEKNCPHVLAVLNT